MSLVSGIGGVFFRSKDPEGLLAWYVATFDLTIDNGFWGQQAGDTVFQPFAADTQYWRADKQVMINFRVTNMDAVLARLDAASIAYWDTPDEDEDFGRFIHLEDPEGNPIELWEPKPV
ncbi:MAG: VOC family protein [Pseudomonadota bacterium]